MRDIFISSNNIISPLGFTTDENFTQLKKNITGVKKHHNKNLSAQPFYAALFSKNNFIKDNQLYTKFEQLLIASVNDALQKTEIAADNKKNILIISSTKGNIDLLQTKANNPSLNKRIALHTSAKLVADHFGFFHQPLIVSNACISGLLGILVGYRLIKSGQYENAVIAGADIISKFILSGFQSFQAVSDEICKPFDAARNGITLGEAAGTIILTSQKKYSAGIKVSGGAITNDANHISGPSRTGNELGTAIKKTINEAQIASTDIDFISAHGTATIYNDEMEAKAITLANLQSVPVNSLKGFYGHTLGAAGLIESVISVQSLKENIIIPTKGFTQSGVSVPINICAELLYRPIKNCLKTASGFGGCNAAMIFGKQ